MDTLETDLRPYLRDAAVCLVPQVTEEQLERIGTTIRRNNAFTIVRRLTASTILVEGFPVRASTLHEAEALTWEIVAFRVRGALQLRRDVFTKITSIDVREPVGAFV